MIRQPVVYKPTNVTKYLDAYTEKLNLAKQEAAKLQREREKERKAEQDKLGMYTNRKYASPVHQRAYDTYIKDFYAKAQKEPEKFSRLLNETIPLIEGLDAENKSVSTMYNEAIKSGDYRNIEDFQNAFMTYDGGEKLDVYNRGGVMTEALDPFNKLQKSFALGQYVSKEGNDILKNLASDPKTLSRYFNRDIREKDLNDMTMTEIFTSIKPEAVEEVMGIILSSNPEAISQAEFDYSRGIENEQEKRDNAIKMATQDLQKFLGVASITKTLKKGEDNRERRGGLTLDNGGYRNDLFGFTVSEGETNEGKTLTDVEGRTTKYRGLPSVGSVIGKKYTFIMPREIYKDSDLVALNWYDEDGETIRGKIDQIREYEDGSRTILITSSDYGTIELPFSQDNISKLKNLEISEADVSTMLKRSDKKEGGGSGGKKTINRSDIANRASAAGRTPEEYERLLIEKGIEIIE
jgi:hypothetical protein